MQKKRLLIIGCGDVMLRALPWLTTRFRVYALLRNKDKAAPLRNAGVRVLAGDLDQPASLRRLAGIAEYLLHAAPPSPDNSGDPRSRRLCAALSRSTGRMVAQPPKRAIYISTTGVYGDCAGEWVSETRPPNPESARARRRTAAESQMRAWAGRNQVTLSILRAPGIYAADRLPLSRLQRGTPVLQHEEDGFSNHIHADDLARSAGLALFRGRPQRVYHICDHAPLKMGDWFDAIAAHFSLPRPIRISASSAASSLDAGIWSFMRESRRLENKRLQTELRIRLEHPEALAFIASLPATTAKK